LPNSFKNDSDFLGESGGSAPHEDQDLELKKQELELCQTGPKSSGLAKTTSENPKIHIFIRIKIIK
jgi:hypothetical protein